MMLGSATQPSQPLRKMTERCLKTACRMPKDQRSFGEGEGAVVVLHFVSGAQQAHGEVSVFGNGDCIESAEVAHSGGSPSANGAGDNAHRADGIESTALEVLAGDVFKGLPARPE